MRHLLFIIGAGRSGTTMLQMALNRHSQIVIPPETAFFTLLCRSRRGQAIHWRRIEKDLGIRLPGAARRVKNQAAQPAEALNSQEVGELAATQNSHEFCDRRRLRAGAEARECFEQLADAYLERLGKSCVSHFGEKSPEHQRRLPLILQTLPDAKFVLIYRDGRDVAVSLSKLPWMPRDVYVNFALWLHYYRIQQWFCRKWPEKVFLVKYEELVYDPPRVLAEVLSFLGLGYEPQVAEGSGNGEGICPHEYGHKARALAPIRADRVGAWKGELSAIQVARLESWGSKALTDLGYDLSASGRAHLPIWHFPFVYGRAGCWLAKRAALQKVDEYFGTTLNPENQTLRGIDEPGAHDYDATEAKGRVSARERYRVGASGAEHAPPEVLA